MRKPNLGYKVVFSLTYAMDKFELTAGGSQLMMYK